mmetsp:Transcript_115/g.405  ORF Transcript_115/g.405 Transcript_115/m.405 type:complete len:130 (-) Transcript_115:248-637(-)|eukprot:CAMPEP_0117675566 /NCGR_PEP_ID=MMETSP0804-20121206/15679_1 /TAXON_ID=1074897 /ORGANISM="Tetraselmis astigmatica, Strain CCMP880" /LENGTH=129 /DNA_ID=CAMNT_0005484589 /DNA_START=81 /DNA_END=470 /DNA_ORIENTATION=+
MQVLSQQLRSAVLSHLRVPVSGLAASTTQAAGASLSIFGVRGFADAGLDKAEVTDRIINVVKNFEKVDPAKVTPSANFQTDLGLDSLDTVEVVMAFEEEFAIEIPDADADKIASVADAVSFVSSHPMAK